MTYRRVVPRDLFNEANLLKCYAQLWLFLDFPGHHAALSEGDGSPFEIVQSPDDGSLTVANLPFTVGGKAYRLTRPLNSRRPWPLYAQADDEDEPVEVFEEDGDLTEEFEVLIGMREPDTSDIPEAGPEWFDKAERRTPEGGD